MNKVFVHIAGILSFPHSKHGHETVARWGAVARLVKVEEDLLLNKQLFSGGVSGDQTVARAELSAAIALMKEVQFAPLMIYTLNSGIVRAATHGKIYAHENEDLWREFFQYMGIRNVQFAKSKSKVLRLEAFKAARQQLTGDPSAHRL